MMTRRWSDLSRGTRQLLLAGGTIEGLLKVVALVDLRRRPSTDVRGSKKVWAVAIVVLNSGGLVPIGYFLKGRRRLGG